ELCRLLFTTSTGCHEGRQAGDLAMWRQRMGVRPSPTPHGSLAPFAFFLVAVLDRAGVKPVDYDPSQDQPQPSWDPGKLSAEQRQELREILEKAVGKGKP